ncbi:hypothetical protein PGTUg99_012019 [Puccinia graminis f. sp. tritici]|uniref:Uncharacterized protein n=1 Tax=Puccinia graminis f. sp. tritici TaxID=56615 RepID=A0A5B0NBJ1_PUCGR|nr:hypothetical protein PGTUg99_012019 [Puccinia graminis f. sp. tritici]
MSHIPPSSHGTPTRPPSRQSTRVITPVRTDPNFVRPNHDSRKALPRVEATSAIPSVTDNQSLASESTTVLPSKQSRRPKVSKSVVISDPEPIESTTPTNVGKKNNRKRPAKDSAVQSQPTEKVMDLTQDSDEENSRLFRKKRRKVVKPSDEDFDDVEDYFHKPYLADENWCGNPYKKGLGTRSNLYLHRDGNLHRAPCASRSAAVTAGCKLPLTPKEIESQKKAHEQNQMAKYIRSGSGSFDVRVFNQLLVFWMVKHSLPWMRIEDFDLGVACDFAKRGIKLYSRTWAANEAHDLYCNLQKKVVAKLTARAHLKVDPHS